MHFFLNSRGPEWPTRGSRGSKFKMKDVWHVGCLFSAILAKGPVFDLKDIFLDPTDPLGPFLGGSKGTQGVKIEVEGYMVCGVSF